MKFWDSSALVPLLVREASTKTLEQLWDSDIHRVIWWGTGTECLSALSRREREGRLMREEVGQAEDILHSVLDSAYEVQPCAEVRQLARRLLMTHPLRAGDALQLAGALLVSGIQTRSMPFVTLDKNLANCAAREGFAVIPHL
jgi:hypothetical protein